MLDHPEIPPIPGSLDPRDYTPDPPALRDPWQALRRFRIREMVRRAKAGKVPRNALPGAQAGVILGTRPRPRPHALNLRSPE